MKVFERCSRDDGEAELRPTPSASLCYTGRKEPVIGSVGEQ